MNGEKPPGAYCPLIEGFCTALTCSSCNILHEDPTYEDIQWICGICAKSKEIVPLLRDVYTITQFTCYTQCIACTKVSLVNGYVLKTQKQMQG